MSCPFEELRNGLLAVTLPAGTQDVIAVVPPLIQLFVRQGKKLSVSSNRPRLPLPLPSLRICFHQRDRHQCSMLPQMESWMDKLVRSEIHYRSRAPRGAAGFLIDNALYMLTDVFFFQAQLLCHSLTH